MQSRETCFAIDRIGVDIMGAYWTLREKTKYMESVLINSRKRIQWENLNMEELAKLFEEIRIAALELDKAMDEVERTKKALWEGPEEEDSAKH